MTMRAGLVSLLAGESTITAVVPAGRIFVGNVPQESALPYIYIMQSGSDEMNAMDGTGNLRKVGFDIYCVSDRSVQAESLGNIVRDFVKDYTGTAGSETISAVYLVQEEEEYYEPRDGSEIGLHVTILDFEIFFNPA